MAQTMHLASFGPAGTAMASLRGLPIIIVGVAQGWHSDGKLMWLAHCVCQPRQGQQRQAYVACRLRRSHEKGGRCCSQSKSE